MTPIEALIGILIMFIICWVISLVHQYKMRKGNQKLSDYYNGKK